MKTLECRGCGNTFISPRKKKYCTSDCQAEDHNRRRRVGEPKPNLGLKILSENKELIAFGKKRCSKCMSVHSLDNYRAAKNGLAGKSAFCNDCALSRDRAYRKTPEGREVRRNTKIIARRRLGARPQHEIEAETQAARIKRMFEVHHRARIRAMVKAEAPSSTELYRHKYRNSPKFQAKERLRRQINKAAKRDGVSELIRAAIRRDGQSPMVEKVLGYSVDEFMQHMERQFTRGMTWGHWRRGEIHIDHIVPQKGFDLSDPEEYRACWSLPNLQPLWARDNLAKSGKRATLL